MTEKLLTYSELVKRTTLLARFKYAVLGGSLGVRTFGFDRDLNQAFYGSYMWKRARDEVLVRDEGFDLGVAGYPIMRNPHVHHMNPLTVDDFVNYDEDRLFNPEYLITVSHRTHNAIHFGDESQLPQDFVERRPGDHLLWRE